MKVLSVPGHGTPFDENPGMPHPPRGRARGAGPGPTPMADG